MATSKNPISFQSESSEQTKVIFDRKGNAISLSKTELGLFAGFCGDYRNTIAPSSLIAESGSNFFPKGSPLANASGTPVPDMTTYAAAEDFRVEYDLFLQNSHLGAGGISCDPRSGNTCGTDGHGLYTFDETVEQSNVIPTIIIKSGGGPDYNAKIKKFGISSISCNGQGGFSVPAVAVTGGVAFETWFYFTSGGLPTPQTIFAKGGDPLSGGISQEWRLFSDEAGGAGVSAGLYFTINSANVFVALDTAVTAGMWHHIAIAATPSQATKLKTFFNGTQVSAYTSAITFNNYSNIPISVGCDAAGFTSTLWTGLVDDFIIKAGGNETGGYMAKYEAATFGVPTASHDFDQYVKYHFPFDGTHGGQLFTVRTANSSFAQVAKMEETSRLRVRKTRNYGSSTGFSAGNSMGYIHGMESGAIYPLSYVIDLALGISSAKGIAAGEQANSFLGTMQSIVSSTNNYFPYLLGQSSGVVTGPINPGISGQFGPSGGSQYTSFSFVPSKENIDYLSTFMSAVNANFIPRTSTQTYPMADATGEIKYFTVPDMMNLFKDLMRIYTTNEGIVGANNNYIKTATTLSSLAKVVPFTASTTTIATLDVGELGGTGVEITPPAK